MYTLVYTPWVYHILPYHPGYTVLPPCPAWSTYPSTPSQL